MTKTQADQASPIAIIRGVGDVGSAIAWKLLRAGFVVICHENRQPRTIRRRMAFCDALWKGEAVLDGVTARLVKRLENILPVARKEAQIALYCGPFDALVSTIKPSLIVDGRIQKFSKVEPLKGLADLTVGVGPSFHAGEDVDLVIESCWGDELGKIITHGFAAEPVAQPPRLNGIGRERFVRAQQEGRFETELEIGQFVKAGEEIGKLDGKTILASISGHLRGLLTPGLSVIKGEKLCEIDPRNEQAHFEGLAERPKGIADGVMSALYRFVPLERHPVQLKSLMDQWGLEFTGEKSEFT
ncbi:hypothetical protein [Candidatus Terasakiella magnetica]|nr:hypothetical protein [Candidatus Terasakiella magnetica]